MKKQNKKLFWTIGWSLLAGILIQLCINREWVISSDLIANIITIISIFFGFYITSFTIFSTSRYISELYKIDDSDDPSQTLMHTILFKYKSGLLISLISLVYFIVFFFLLVQSDNSISISDKYAYPVISVFILNIFYAYKMLTILIKVIEQEARQNKK